MSRYIDADLAIAYLEDFKRKARQQFKFIILAADEDAIIKFINEKCPTADVAPVVHGRWETEKEDIEWNNSLKRKYCTNCGKRPHFDKEKRTFILSDYCPNCGAKMRCDNEQK